MPDPWVFIHRFCQICFLTVNSFDQVSLLLLLPAFSLFLPCGVHLRGELSHWNVLGSQPCVLLYHPLLHRQGHLFIRPGHMFLLRSKVAEMGAGFLIIDAEQGFSFVVLFFFLEQGLHDQGRGEQRRLFWFVLDRDPSVCRKPREQWLFQGRAAAEEPARGSLKAPLRRTRPAGG